MDLDIHSRGLKFILTRLILNEFYLEIMSLLTQF
jgi:hypothetical protein